MLATDSASQSTYASLPRGGKRTAFRQSLTLQQIMLEIAQDDESKGTEKAAAARAWVELHEVQRRMLGLGSPKPVPAANDPSNGPAQRKRGSAAKTQDVSTDGPE